MKKYIILSIWVGCLFLVGCKEWLTVYPEDEVAEGDLFETGEGYRTALNGIYQQLSEEDLYGKNLTLELFLKLLLLYCFYRYKNF